MALLELFWLALFVISGGLLFNDRFRRNWFAVGIAGLLVNLFLFYLVCFVSLNSVLEVGVNLARKMLRVDLQNWKGSLRVLEHQRPLVELAAREVLLKRNLRIIRPVYDRENDRWRYEFSLWRAGPLVFIIAGLMATAFQWLGAGAQSPTSTDSKAGRPKVAPAAVNTGGREDIQQPTQSKTQNPVGRESHEIPVTSTKAESAISLTFIDEGGVEYALSKNADGFVLKSSSMTLYLGNSCDAYSPEHGKGRWGWANGRFAIELQNVNFGFPMQSPPFDDLRCRL